jgi:DNA-binding MarR family transcriptional regulator
MMTVDQRRAAQGRQPGQSKRPASRHLRTTAEDYAEGQAGGDVLIQLHHAAAAARQHVEQTVLRRVRLSWTAFAVLRRVSAGDRIETRVVAAEAGIAKGTLTGVVDTLVKRGLLRRRAHPKDGRLVLLEATRPGRHLVGRIMPAIQAEEAFVLRGLSGKQVDQFSGVLLQLVQHLDGDEGRARRR